MVLSVVVFVATIVITTWGLQSANPPSPPTTTYRDTVEDCRAEVVFVGNSLVGYGVDPDVFAKASGRPTARVWNPGAASAWWYLASKNHVVAAEPRPKWLVIVYRDYFLTDPTANTQDNFAEDIRLVAGEDEPLLEELTYDRVLPPFEAAIRRRWPVYHDRHRHRTAIEEGVRDTVTSWFGDSTNRLARKALRPRGSDRDHIMGIHVANSLERWKDRHDFAAEVETSYLPHLIELAHTNDVGLVFVKNPMMLHILMPHEEPEHYLRYARELEAYLEARSVPHLDFSYDPRIRPEHFLDGVHLNKKGKAHYSRILAEALEPIFTR